MKRQTMKQMMKHPDEKSQLSQGLLLKSQSIGQRPLPRRTFYDNGGELREEVRQALHSLPFRIYLALVRELLSSSGYSGVRSLGNGVERNSLSIGGIDLIAFCHTDLTVGLTAVQIKQLRAEVKRRFVDELRGAMARHGVEQGMIVATGRFSAAAREAAVSLTILPVRLVDGDELASMMIERGQGIRIAALPTRPGQEVKWEADADYFERLSAKQPSGNHAH